MQSKFSNFYTHFLITFIFYYKNYILIRPQPMTEIFVYVESRVLTENMQRTCEPSDLSFLNLTVNDLLSMRFWWWLFILFKCNAHLGDILVCRYPVTGPGPVSLNNNSKIKSLPTPRWKRVVLRINGMALSGGTQNVDPKVNLFDVIL